jgi:predicted nucleic acid-binding protein
MTPLLVPDASVILKWVLPPGEEPHAEEARRLLADFVAGEVDFVVPSLWYFEVGNTVARRLPAHAARILAALRDLGLPQAEPGGEWEATALDLVATYGVTFYDAAYHALAIQQAGTLVSGDGTYRQRVEGAGSLAALAGYPWR